MNKRDTYNKSPGHEICADVRVAALKDGDECFKLVV
jgi:hypothetical protein